MRVNTPIQCLLIFLAWMMGSHALPAEEASTTSPVKLIFDTDMGNDVDDALALAMIHIFVTRGNAELLAVTLTIPDRRACSFTHALNTFYGRPDIPIGVNPNAPDGFFPEMDFLSLTKRRQDYPWWVEAKDAPKAVDLLRKTLAEAEDASVVIVQVGTFTNMADLLDSKPDTFSELAGRELVKRKVRLLSLMGGDFVNERAEYNVRLDIPAARKVAELWPTPIIWSGSEVGDAVTFPATAIESGFNYVEKHIIREAYQLYKPTPHERPCWDLTSAFHAIHPTSGLFDLSPRGDVRISRKGVITFAESETGRDQYLKVSREHAEILRNLFALLVTARPVR